MAATKARTRGPRSESVVWIDHREAVIVGCDPTGQESIAVVTRKPQDTEAGFDVRAAEEVAGRGCRARGGLGPRICTDQFERSYVGLRRRPDRLVDVEPRNRRSRKPAR